jgi:hypothetical protein
MISGITRDLFNMVLLRDGIRYSGSGFRGTRFIGLVDSLERKNAHPTIQSFFMSDTIQPAFGSLSRRPDEANRWEPTRRADRKPSSRLRGGIAS